MSSEPVNGTLVERLQAAVAAFVDSDLKELSVVGDDLTMTLTRGRPAVPVAQAPAAAPPYGSVVSPPAPPTEAAAPGSGPGHEPSAPPLAASQAAPAQASAAPGHGREGAIAVTSPTVGTFYRRPSPDQDPYVSVGGSVAVGDPIGTVEVMKMFTEVRTEHAGEVIEICVEDGAMVEFGQTLMYLASGA